jgi:hypothetical protein
MSLKVCVLGLFAFFFILTSCDGNKQKEEYEDLDRMAGELLQPLEGQKIVEDIDPIFQVR